MPRLRQRAWLFSLTRWLLPPQYPVLEHCYRLANAAPQASFFYVHMVTKLKREKKLAHMERSGRKHCAHVCARVASSWSAVELRGSTSTLHRKLIRNLHKDPLTSIDNVHFAYAQLRCGSRRRLVGLALPTAQPYCSSLRTVASECHRDLHCTAPACILLLHSPLVALPNVRNVHLIAAQRASVVRAGSVVYQECISRLHIHKTIFSKQDIGQLVTMVPAEEMLELTDCMPRVLAFSGTIFINKELNRSVYNPNNVMQAYWILATRYYKGCIYKLFREYGNVEHHRDASRQYEVHSTQRWRLRSNFHLMLSHRIAAANRERSS
jgi:hypothetical protein